MGELGGVNWTKGSPIDRHITGLECTINKLEDRHNEDVATIRDRIVQIGRLEKQIKELQEETRLLTVDKLDLRTHIDRKNQELLEEKSKLKRFEDEAKMYRDRAVAAEDRLKLLEDERVLERKDMEPYFAALKLCQTLDGYTIVDFQSVWLEQERTARHKVEHSLKFEHEQVDKYFIKYKILEKAMFDIRAYCIKGEFSSDKLAKIESITSKALKDSHER